MIWACTETSQRRSGLIQDQKGRIQRQRTRQSDALRLPAAELVRVAAHEVAGQTDLFQSSQKRRDRVAHLRPRHGLVRAQRLGHQVKTVKSRIQRGEWILQDYLHALAEAPHRVIGERKHVNAIETHAAAGRAQGAAANSAPRCSCRIPIRRRRQACRRPRSRNSPRPRHVFWATRAPKKLDRREKVIDRSRAISSGSVMARRPVQMTGGTMSAANHRQRWLMLPAARHHEFAAGRESAAGRRFQPARHITGNDLEIASPGCQAWAKAASKPCV